MIQQKVKLYTRDCLKLFSEKWVITNVNDRPLRPGDKTVQVWANVKVVDESSVNEYVTVSPKSMATRLYKKSGHPKMLVGRNRHDLAPWSVTCSKFQKFKFSCELQKCHFPWIFLEILNINIDATYPSAGSINPEVELRYAEIDFETGSVSNYKLVTALSKVRFQKMATGVPHSSYPFGHKLGHIELNYIRNHTK